MVKQVHLTKELRILAELFADKREKDSSFYKKRGGFKRRDIVAGAMGEIGACILLRRMGYPVINPDFGIHGRGKKSYSADITDGEFCFHVKSQSFKSREKYGESWILQRSDKLVSGPSCNDWLILNTVDLTNNVVHVEAIVKAKTLVERELVSECRINWFRATKVALYLDEIKKVLKKKYYLVDRTIKEVAV